MFDRRDGNRSPLNDETAGKSMTDRHTHSLTQRESDRREKIGENEIDRFDHSIKRHISRENDPLIDSFISENNGLYSHLTPDSFRYECEREREKKKKG